MAPAPQHETAHELIPRPERTAQALRAALAKVAPARLEEMQATMDAAFSQAIEEKSLTPIQAWLLVWARDIEIARRTDLRRRYQHAQDVLATYDKHEHGDEGAVNRALAELSAVLDEALQAVRG
ncbi:hypothetical protein [Streptomyces sp. NRRL S-87]|uniref:hypothetical protein n=1 Tax=Streptomyces sp. NRRL S-87 TaxID=1463920 RepID=UPI001F1DD642|nr:hypothetical protein [Streptomyces sp. NRRL S-87]